MKIEISEEHLNKCFRRVLREYGIEDIGTFSEIIVEAELYKWHDLRKDPEDLPPEQTTVWAYCRIGNSEFYREVKHIEDGKYSGYGVEVLGWQLIKPFNKK